MPDKCPRYATVRRQQARYVLEDERGGLKRVEMPGYLPE
jgi:hypothetical protein